MEVNPLANNPSGHRPPGHRAIRIPRVKPLRLSIPSLPVRKPSGVSLLTLAYGFAGMIGLGTILLLLPISSNFGQWTPFVDSLFTATSAVCVTGLVVVDTLTHWNFFGQLVILVLIQLGGLGFMTSTTIFLIAAGRRIGLRERLLIGESVGISGIGGMVKLARSIAIFSLIAEAIGAIILYDRFSAEYDQQTAIWKSIFQSVSAFNNAGFDIFGGFHSLTGHHNDYLVLLTTAGLVILGGISFMVFENLFRSRGLHRSSVDTKLVLLITGILLGVGTLFVFVSEFNNPQTMGPMPLPYKVLNSFFQSVTCRSSGFNTIDTGSLTVYALFFIMILMYIGGASGSTAGGIKVNTSGMIIATIWNTIKGRENPGAFGREFHVQQIFRGLTLLVLSASIIVTAFLILSFTESFRPTNILFETVSAFGTVGLTTGITPELSTAGRLVIIVTMFVGRLGPLTLTMALAKAQHTSILRYPKESIRIG